MASNSIEQLVDLFDSAIEAFRSIITPNADAALRVENERLRGALERIAKDNTMNPWGHAQDTLDTLYGAKGTGHE